MDVTRDEFEALERRVERLESLAPNYPSDPAPPAANLFAGSVVHVSTWQAGRGFGDPNHITEQINRGIPYRPILQLPRPWQGQAGDQIRYGEKHPGWMDLLRDAAEQKWPVTLKIENSECEGFAQDDRYESVWSRDENGNMVTKPNGKPFISPMSSVEHWRDVGDWWGSMPWWTWAEPYLSDAELDVLSNNEPDLLPRRWWDRDARFRQLVLDRGGDYEFQWRSEFRQRFRELWAALITSLPSNVPDPETVGYGQFCYRLRQWDDHLGYSWQRHIWDKPSWRYYYDASDDTQDGQQAALSSNYSLAEHLDWHGEISVWMPEGAIRRRDITPERYEGTVGFHAFLMLPECVREFHAHRTDPDGMYVTHTHRDWHNAVIEAVSRLNDHSEFLRGSQPVPSQTRQWPERLFGSKQNGEWQIPGPIDHPCYLLAATDGVFACCREKGNRRIVYAHSPLGEISRAQIEYVDDVVSVPVEGIFLEV